MTDEPKRDAFEVALTRCGESQRANTQVRDELVLGAVACGISKHRVHVLTGIARTTIDDILKKPGTSRRDTKESE